MAITAGPTLDVSYKLQYVVESVLLIVSIPLMNVTIWCLSSKLDQCSNANGATLKRKIPDMKPLFGALLSGSACRTQARLDP